MKVVHFCRTFSKLSETFIYDVIAELDLTEINNKVVTFKHINKLDRPFPNVKLLSPTIRHYAIKFGRKLMSSFGLRRYDPLKEAAIIRGKLLTTFIEKERPDLIHAHFGSQGWTIMPIAQKFGIPLVVSFHGYDAFRLPNSEEWRSKFIDLFKIAFAITVVSKSMKTQLLSLGCPVSKLHLLHVGKRIAEYPLQPTSILPIRNFISIGRICEKKGFFDCIESFKMVLAAHPDVKLRIIGVGELEPQLKALITDQKLEKSIFLLGSLPHKEVIKYMKEADAFILCSKTGVDGDKEGIPAVLMEAQALGLPCISTLHSGIPEVIPPSGQQLLAREGDVSDIASKINSLITLPKEQLLNLRVDGRTLIDSEFNLEKQTLKLKDLYYSSR